MSVTADGKSPGDQVISRALMDAGKRLDSLQGFYEAAIKIIKDHSDQLFATGGSAAEQVPKWKPLAKSTLKARAKRWGYYKNTPSKPGVLRWTGAMQESARMTSTAKQGKLEYEDKKAAWHYKGGGRLPSRKIIDLAPNIVNREIARALQTEIYRQLGTAGLRATM